MHSTYVVSNKNAWESGNAMWPASVESRTSILRSRAEKDLRSASMSPSSDRAESSVSSSERSAAFFSAMISVRTSDHEVWSAGEMVRLARLKSRTLIWLSTCCFTIGRMAARNKHVEVSGSGTYSASKK